jgi:hypothetical protein
MSRRNHDLVKEPAKRLSGGVLMLVLTEPCRSDCRFLPEDLTHVAVKRRRRRLDGRGRQFGFTEA